ncbi:hypothetical protein [Rhizobium paknamense]|uniref:DUF2946 domain-containing protein n=1 Tax=Rhizobium paknamense TaxID=1206817 RepID=A0ABU0IEM0_9HYPH|nr:hypothetical protein [Rhizobium paknamense]MDQ0456691.1 hypothetical protein [Rhizobium paknamense]
MATGRIKRWHLAVHALCVLALIALGLGHRLPVLPPAEAAIAELAIPLLPDGTRPDICDPLQEGHDHAAGAAGQKQDHSSTHHDLKSQGCEACRIQSGAALPAPPATLSHHLVALGGAIGQPDRENPQTSSFSAHRKPRGPPSITA